MNKAILITLAIGSTAALCGCGWLVVRNRNRDTDTAEFITKLESKFDPASKSIETNDAMDMDYHKSFSQGQLLSPMEAIDKAEMIADAWGESLFENDDEEQVYSTFRSLKNPGQVSQVAEAYYLLKDKKITLIDDIKDRMWDSEIGIVMGIINQIEQKWQSK